MLKFIKIKYPQGLPFVLLRFQSLVAANLIISVNRTWFSPPIDADTLGDMFLISWWFLERQHFLHEITAVAWRYII